MSTNEERVRDIRKVGIVPTGMVDYSTATLSDGLQKIGVTGHVLESAIRPVLPFSKMAGFAVTLKLAAAEQPSSYSSLMAQAFEAGKQVVSPILVIECPQHLSVPGSGGAHVMRHHFGFVGCLLDGAARDIADLHRMNFPIFCRSINAEYVFGTMRGVSFNERVCVGGVEIDPGDVVIGDHDGVVAVPAKHFQDVILACDEILAQERRILEKIDSGIPYLEVLRREQPEAFSDS